MADNANTKVLPPVVLVVALALGTVVGGLVPTRLLPAEAAIPVGIVLVGSSVLLLLAAVRELRRANTAFDVRKSTSSIVTTGAFRLSRNPVYLSMLLLYAGLAVLINSPWMLLLGIPAGSALCLTAIRPEERYLEAKFGASYREYCAAVPRWIGLRSFVRKSSAA